MSIFNTINEKIKLVMSNGAEMVSGVLGSVMVSTGTMSMVDSIEQALRILLLLISITTGIMFMIINRKKFIRVLKDWVNDCPED